MRWIKHLTNSWEDEKLAAITSEHGLEIYGFWWRILEIIGKQMDASSKTDCQYSAKTWGKFAGISAKKFQKFARILAEKKLIFIESGCSEIKINVPKLAEYRDEWSQRQYNTRNKTRE